MSHIRELLVSDRNDGISPGTINSRTLSVEILAYIFALNKRRIYSQHLSWTFLSVRGRSGLSMSHSTNDFLGIFQQNSLLYLSHMKADVLRWIMMRLNCAFSVDMGLGGAGV